MAAKELLTPELEQLLIQQSKLASLGECVAHLTHELSNPLAIINSKVEDMLRRLKTGALEPARLEQDLRKILETTDRINKVSKTFLNFSRKTSDTDPTSAFRLRQAIDDSIQICHPRLNQHQVELKIDVTADLQVCARSWEITQILVNLIQNSADAVAGLEHRWVELKVSADSQNVYVSVTDSGQGIPAEIRPNLMKPFFTTKKAGAGSGIGLCLSHRLAHSNGGKLSLNEASEKTQFVLEIPKAS